MVLTPDGHCYTIGAGIQPEDDMRITAEAIYLGDNGRCYCGEHLGASAKHTGRDLSGQPIYRVTPEDAQEAARMGANLTCEQPRCGRTARTIHLP
jgi:hypothetical protein